jgi:hypothetical protein
MRFKPGGGRGTDLVKKTSEKNSTTINIDSGWKNLKRDEKDRNGFFMPSIIKV